MGISLFTSTYKALAHLAPNWDTQLRTDMAALETATTALIGGVGTIGYPGTVTDFSSTFKSQLTKAANVGTLTLGVNPGANAYSSSSSNNLVASLPSGFRPAVPTVMVCPLFVSAAWTGGVAHVQVNPDGTCVVNYANPSTVPSGTLLIGSTSFALP